MTRYLILLGATGLLLTAGCRKDDVVSCAPTISPTVLDLADFTRNNSMAPQIFTLKLDTSQTITTAGGATLKFPARGLLLPTGGVATRGAQVRIREIYTVPDIVLANVPTDMVRRGNLLVSGGEFNIQVWQNTTRLRLAPGQKVAVQSPVPANQDTTPQHVWQQPAAVMASDSAGWRWSGVLVQQLPGLYRASLPLDSIGWWNIDQFWHAYSTAGVTPVTVTTTATAAGETRVYLRPVGYNGLMRLWHTPTSATDWQRRVPIGAEMVAVVQQSVNGQLYYGTQRITISNGLTISPVVTAMSEAEAVRLIRQL